MTIKQYKGTLQNAYHYYYYYYNVKKTIVECNRDNYCDYLTESNWTAVVLFGQLLYLLLL